MTPDFQHHHFQKDQQCMPNHKEGLLKKKYILIIQVVIIIRIIQITINMRFLVQLIIKGEDQSKFTHQGKYQQQHQFILLSLLLHLEKYLKCRFLLKIYRHFYFKMKFKILSKLKILHFKEKGTSFDNFKNFEDRGLYFNKLIKKQLNGI